MRVLVIEDELKIAKFIQKTIASLGYVVDFSLSSTDAEFKFSEVDYDLVILDVMLGDQSGIELCRKFKQKRPDAKVLMVTALSQVADRVLGLDSGADDYLTKPFHVDELLARVRALIRRSNELESVLKFQDIEMNLKTRRVKRSGMLIKLTVKEFALLEYLLRNPGRPLSRAQIAQHVWDLDFDPGSNVVDAFIKQLRKKIDHDKSNKLIQTVIGVGYCLGDS